MYDRIGFQDTYLMLGCFVLAITVVSAFTLSGRQQSAGITQGRSPLSARR